MAQRDSATGALTGISVYIAETLSQSLEIDRVFEVFTSARDVFRAFECGCLDVGFLAIDETRSRALAFTSPYVVIAGSFVVATTSQFTSLYDVDQRGIQIAVGEGSAYDLYLSGALKHATLLRVPTSPDALALLLQGKVAVAAGVKQMVERLIEHSSAFRLLEPSFMDIRQAICCPKERACAHDYLDTFMSEMKASGQIGRFLHTAGQGDIAAA